MIPLKDIRIRLSHHRTNLAPHPGSQTALERMDTIKGHIQLEGDLDAAQRQRLLKIAGRCWMHRTLSAGLSIKFDLQDSSHAGLPGQTLVFENHPDGTSTNLWGISD